MRNTEIGAVLGINQLKKLDGFIEKRNKNFLYFLSQLDKLPEKEITIDVLKKHNIVTKNISRVKVKLSGEINRPINLVGIKPTKGAKAAIEAAKGTISE